MQKTLLRGAGLVTMGVAVISILFGLQSNHANLKSDTPTSFKLLDPLTSKTHLSKLEIETISSAARDGVGGGTATNIQSHVLNGIPVWSVQVQKRSKPWTVFLNKKNLLVIQKIPS